MQGIDLGLLELFMLVKLTRFERLENLVASFSEQTKAIFKVGRVTI
jgi:hypothetical protein